MVTGSQLVYRTGAARTLSQRLRDGVYMLGCGSFLGAFRPPFRYTCSMQLTLELPDELTAVLASFGQDTPRAAFQAIALEAYRERKLSTARLAKDKHDAAALFALTLVFSSNMRSGWNTLAKISNKTGRLTTG